MNTLIILAHPALHRSRVNAALARAAGAVPGVHVVDIYESYPDFEIDVPVEQARLSQTDVLVLQHPMFWYSCPALLKEWIDLVFEHGYAYGAGDESLRGKTLAQAVSTGGDAPDFTAEGSNHCSMKALLLPFEATARFCGMRWRPPFLTHGTHVLEDEDLARACLDYQRWLRQLGEEGSGDER